MADFYRVHGDALDAARGRIRRGECWTIALKEPLPNLSVPRDGNITITVIRFIASEDGTLKPATELDLAEIMDWERRHKTTPTEEFLLPSVWRS